ncbi:SixA phosphatase family protein [Acaryochloris marina]|uniref:SixA phosphatase family protein n=1 Tax=Acaryochloris marina TaxID=155978 RepID=UPI0021C36650|nr:phosphoglycerate mutase family protein [Acaryochloris marina]BDM83818.1 phosphoglycerate mutase [Acaryochloris marina MBIC10699]
MKKLFSLVIIVILVFFGLGYSPLAIAQDKHTITHIAIVRHAEKASNSGDTPLSAIGFKRAKTLANMLSSSDITTVITSDALRTIQTAEEYVSSHGIQPGRISNPKDIVQHIKSNHSGQNILIVGHSNTVPEVISQLGISPAPRVGDEYNNLFFVTLFDNDVATMTHLKYEIQK